MKHPLQLILGLFFSGLMLQCQTPAPEPAVPEWPQQAIWYQIMVERFRNGDPANDPTPADMTGSDPAFIPESWTVTPWGHDWYAQEPWLNEAPVENFYHKIQLRRYGGDLQGVLDKLDYIRKLGVNAIYFNPLNDAPSLHKYDARYYHHIDRNFGPDPRGDAALMASENPGDPATWTWTQADKLFLRVVDECHKRGIRVILDYSWNHTGTDFWAIHDLRKNGPRSAYSDWYNIISYDDPATPADEFDYEGWAGYKGLPVVKKDIQPADDKEMPFEGNLVSQSFKDHVYQVTARWLDPNGDGDPSDGIDGFRLDVAGELPMGFWRDYRGFVKNINPDAYLIGEIWWLKWPETMLDPEIYLRGDQFDAVMNYRWYRLARGLFSQGEPAYTPSAFVREYLAISENIGQDYNLAMMNVAASHDTERLSTSLFNKTLYKYQARPTDNPAYKTWKPDAGTRQTQELLLLHQYTFPGAPHIWNGDEVGMWGGDDPDCRKPLVWEDLTYEPEKASLLADQPLRVDTVAPDLELYNYYARLGAMRLAEPALQSGELRFLFADDELGTFAYERILENDRLLVAFNLSDRENRISLPAQAGETYEILFPGKKMSLDVEGNTLEWGLPARSGMVFKRKG